MIKILDSYIIKKFLVTFFGILAMLSIIIPIIDFIGKNETFIRNNMSFSNIMHYYSCFLPFFVNFLIPIIIFISVVFINSNFSQKSEIIAILSCGISFKRFLRPYLVSAFIISIFNFILMAWIIPKANITRIFYEDQLGFSLFSSNNKYIHIRISQDDYLYIEKYKSSTNTGINVTIEKIIENKVLEKFYAKEMKWSEEKKNWIFTFCTTRIMKENGEKIIKEEICERHINLSKNDVQVNPRLYETLSINDLHSYIKDLKKKESEFVKYFITELHVRYMAPFACFILTILGVTISSYRQRKGGKGLQISLGIALAFIYIYFFLFTRNYAENYGTNIFLYVWSANIIFSIICYIFYKKVPK
jgi:lipopolysaccharide export system permease protein